MTRAGRRGGGNLVGREMRVGRLHVGLVTMLLSASLPARAAPDWKEHIFKKDGFAISTPTAPKSQAKTQESPDGKVEIDIYETDFPDAEHPYQVFVSHYPGDVDEKQIIAAVKKAQLGAAKEGKISDEETVNVDGVPGADYTLSSLDFILRSRMLVVGDTTYQVVVTWRNGAARGEAERFIKSFRFLAPSER
jgi:hypothetical protein